MSELRRVITAPLKHKKNEIPCYVKTAGKSSKMPAGNIALTSLSQGLGARGAL